MSRPEYCQGTAQGIACASAPTWLAVTGADRVHLCDVCKVALGYDSGSAALFSLRWSEHTKLGLISAQRDGAQMLYDWIQDQGFSICEIGQRDEYWPVTRSPSSILAAVFNIDEKALEAEKVQMLQDLRRALPGET